MTIPYQRSKRQPPALLRIYPALVCISSDFQQSFADFRSAFVHKFSQQQLRSQHYQFFAANSNKAAVKNVNFCINVKVNN